MENLCNLIMDKRSIDVALIDRSLDTYGLTPEQFRVYLCLVLSPEIEREAIAPQCLMEYSEVDEALEFLASRKIITVGKNIRLNSSKDWLPSEAPVPKAKAPRKQKAAEEESLDKYLEDWNAISPAHWVKHSAIDKVMASLLRGLIAEHGESAFDIFHAGLLYAQQNTAFCLRPEVRLTIKKYLSNGKPFEWAEEYKTIQAQKVAPILPRGKVLPMHPTAQKEELTIETRAIILNGKIKNFPHLKNKAIAEGQALGIRFVNGVFLPEYEEVPW